MALDSQGRHRQERRVLAVVRHPVGGVRTHILYTYPILMEAGYRFTFVIPDYEYHGQFRADVQDWEGVEIVNVPYRDENHRKPRFFATIRSLLKQRRFSLIHSHGIQAAVPAIFANVGRRLPHVMTSQDVFCHVEFPGLMGRLKLHALQHLLRRLDVLIAVSEDTRNDHFDYLPGLSKGPCRVQVIPNGIDLAKYPPPDGQAPDGLRRQLGLARDVFLIGFLGRFMPQKGFMVLVDAIAAIARQALPRPFHLVAVGSGDFLVNYRREIAKKPEVESLISFLEHVPSVGPILKQLDLLVMPSLWEACPILPMEAMVSGVPVVGTDCVGLREVLRDSPSVMVPANDVPALSAALLDAIAKPWQAEAREHVPIARERFDVRHTSSELRNLFDVLTGSRGHSATLNKAFR